MDKATLSSLECVVLQLCVSLNSVNQSDRICSTALIPLGIKFTLKSQDLSQLLGNGPNNVQPNGVLTANGSFACPFCLRGSNAHPERQRQLKVERISDCVLRVI